MLMKETIIEDIRRHITNKEDRGDGKGLSKERLGGDTMGVFLIGGDISAYTKSPPMWNAVFDALRIHAYYQALDIPTREAVNKVLEITRQNPSCIGFNVGMPWKEFVLQQIPELGGSIDESARKAGAVNTVVTKKEMLAGYNTDGEGEIKNLRTVISSFQGLSVLLIGAGGGARGIIPALLDEGVKKVTIVNRTSSNSAKLVAHLENFYEAGRLWTVEEQKIPQLLGSGDYDLVLNASAKGQAEKDEAPYSSLAPTSISLRENHQLSIAALRALSRKRADVVFADLIYNPTETPMLQQARENGFKTINGKGMLVWQAYLALSLMLTVDKPSEDVVEIMSRAFDKASKI